LLGVIDKFADKVLRSCGLFMLLDETDAMLSGELCLCFTYFPGHLSTEKKATILKIYNKYA